MALRREVVDFVRLCLLDQANEIGRVGHVAVVQEVSVVGLVRVPIDIVDACCVERRRTPFHAMYPIAFGEQQPREICSVLAGYSCYESGLGQLGRIDGANRHSSFDLTAKDVEQ